MPQPAIPPRRIIQISPIATTIHTQFCASQFMTFIPTEVLMDSLDR